MPRPRTPVGTYGDIWVSDDGPPYKARTRFRDPDGVLRPVARFGQTKTKARDALKAALRERQREAGVGLTAHSLVAELAEIWLARFEASNRAVGTKQQYRRTLRANVLPALGELKIGEVRVSVADRALQTILERHGYSVAKQSRAVMSAMFGLAVRQDAIPSNPVRDVEELARTAPVKKPRAFTVEEAERVADRLRTIQRALDLDVADLVDFMLMTGCRIGEALACRDGNNPDGEPLLDLAAGTWEINATVVRISGVGLVIQEHPKSRKGWRRIALPPAAVELARRRIGEERLRPLDIRLLDAAGRTRTGHPRILFPSPYRRTLRDPNNCEGDLREVLDGLDCETCQGTGYQLDDDGAFVRSPRGHKTRCTAGPWCWVTSHVFRKTVATRLQEAGCTPLEVSEQLGHSKVSMTMDVYFGREVITSKAATILDR